MRRTVTISSRIAVIVGIALFVAQPEPAVAETPLTTIRVPAYRLGYSAGELILKIIRGESLPDTRVLLPTELVIRRSTVKRP